jgi:UDP:flavonoid glycosyltransferase YjiC (YdhE family)
MNRLADYGIASSFAIGGAASPQIRAAGPDLIELSSPAFEAPAGSDAELWSPYHFLALHSGDIAPLLSRIEVHRKAILDGGPALVVTDINPVAALAARSLRVPHVTISQSLFLPCRRLHSRKWTFPPAVSAINKALAHYGVDLADSAQDLDVGEITLLPSIPEFDPLENAPASFHYLGPILGHELVALSSSPDRSSSCASGMPKIFLYPGRPHDTAGPSGQTLLNVGLSALSGIKAAVSLATGGFEFEIPRYLGRQLEIVPWRVISSAYRPDLIIHHGGHGTCLTALSAGIPSVILPTHSEREYNARNLAALGCGEFAPMHQADVAHVRRAIETVINNLAYARKCQQWSAIIAERRYGGADLAAGLIAQLVEAHSARAG